MEFVPDESEPAPPPPDDDLPEWTEAAPGAHTASPSPPPAMPDSAPRRVLVAEDSIIARIFLVRLLEQDGYVVDAIGSGHELVHAAGRVPWWVVFADTDLPDAVAGSALGRLAPRRADGTPAPVVALVRDADDVRAAAMAGITHTLAKPYEQDALRALLRLLDEPGAPPEPR
jgi:CheY-like chemotaxis protein